MKIQYSIVSKIKKVSVISFCMTTFFSSSISAEQTVLLKIEGVKDKDLSTNIRIYLSQLSNDEADGSERYQSLVQNKVDKALRAKGYYNTKYHFSIIPRPRPQKDLLMLNITLDEPVKLDQRDVQLSGMAKDDKDFIQLIDSEIPPKGEILNHQTYDDFKGSMEKLASSKGYFDAEWSVHRLEVYPSEHVADWRLAYQSGVRYRYGDISFKNSQIREDYLRNILRIKQGDYYYINDLSKLSSDFSSSNWFNSVLVEPAIDSEQKNVALNVLLQPRKKNNVELGIGYESDVGPRFQMRWQKPWINNRGHSIETSLHVSKPEQQIEFGYKIPVKEQPIDYFYEITAGAEREDLNDTEFTGAHLGVQRFWNHETGWAFSLGAKARYDSFKQGDDERNKTFLLYSTASINRTRTDGSRFPLWGDAQHLTVNWGNKIWGSDVNFYTIKASTVWIRTFKNNHRIYLRGEIGYLKTGEFDRIPPILRYFAGGDRSVRGFGYKDISPRNSSGKLIGGSHLATATAEYQYQVYPNWWAATFYDTGLAAKSYSMSELHSGVGVGVRWASPIGSIKLDIATPVKSPSSDKKGVQFYIGIGSEL